MAFDYSTIFAGSEAGDVWLADGSHFQDTARTTAAGDGDPVGSLSGDRGNYNGQQATAGLKPTLRQDAGGKWYLEHAGDYVVAGAAADWIYLHNTAQNSYACAAVRFGNAVDPDALYSIFGTSALSQSSQGVTWYWENRISSAFEQALIYYVATGGNIRYREESFNNELPAQQDAVIEIINNGTSIAGYFNGRKVIENTQSATSSGNPANALAIGAAGGGAFPLTGRLYGLLVTDTIPSESTRNAILRDMWERTIQENQYQNIFPPLTGPNTASVTLTGFPISASGIAVDVSVDRDSSPFYSATGQAANGSGELAIVATGCPLDTGTQTVWIRCTNSDGLAGGVSNNSRAFYSPVEVTVS